MAPEQILGRRLDHRTDIYSLGASFYHLFSGRAPFDADNLMGILMKHVNDAMIPLKELNQRIPASVTSIVEKMMAKKHDRGVVVSPVLVPFTCCYCPV